MKSLQENTATIKRGESKECRVMFILTIFVIINRAGGLASSSIATLPELTTASTALRAFSLDIVQEETGVSACKSVTD